MASLNTTSTDGEGITGGGVFQIVCLPHTICSLAGQVFLLLGSDRHLYANTGLFLMVNPQPSVQLLVIPPPLITELAKLQIPAAFPAPLPVAARVLAQTL